MLGPGEPIRGYHLALRRGGRVVGQRPAKPRTPVRLRSRLSDSFGSAAESTCRPAEPGRRGARRQRTGRQAARQVVLVVGARRHVVRRVRVEERGEHLDLPAADAQLPETAAVLGRCAARSADLEQPLQVADARPGRSRRVRGAASRRCPRRCGSARRRTPAQRGRLAGLRSRAVRAGPPGRRRGAARMWSYSAHGAAGSFTSKPYWPLKSIVSTAPVAATSSTSVGAQLASASSLKWTPGKRASRRRTGSIDGSCRGRAIDEAHRLRLEPEHVVQRPAGLAEREVERRRLERPAAEAQPHVPLRRLRP